MKARIPVLSQTAPARLDLWGQPAPRGQFPYGLSTIAPVSVSNVKNDPINASLLAAGAHISKPNATVGGVKLTPEQYRSYQQMSGQLGFYYGCKLAPRSLPLLIACGNISWPPLAYKGYLRRSSKPIYING